jgi:hypothetical protein
VADLLYAYAITNAGIDVAKSPAGVDDGAVRSIEAGGLAAVVSPVDATVYSAERVEAHTENVAWVAPRATAHDAVVTWIGDRGPVIPLPIFTLFRDEDRVRTMLHERGAHLQATMQRVGAGEEYGLRIFRLDETLMQYVGKLSSRVEALERQAREATPGQRYLIERKLETERRSESRRVASDVAQHAYATLAPLALESVREALPAKGRDGTTDIAVLNAYFLIPRGKLDAFQQALTDIVQEHAAHGFRFDFTGPWPPYHFVRGDAGVSVPS